MTLQIREPILHPTPVLELRPTQMTLGMREVEVKRKSWREFDPEALEKRLASHMVPVIVGPRRERFLIDHHHLVRALHEEGITSVFVTVAADFHQLDVESFWNMMDFRGWTHPFDGKGRRREYEDLPKTVEGMQDDPFRSLAGELRNIGGFAKDSTPFSEFVWADFLRRRLKPKDVKRDFAAALDAALALAKSQEANYLPGWCAPHGKADGSKSRGKKTATVPKPAED
jgi:hypothetical protein